MTTKLEILEILSGQASEELRRYILFEWYGWALLLLVFISGSLACWKKRASLEPDDIQWGRIGAAVLGFFSLLLFLFFLPFTLKCLFCPELEALKTILGGG